MSVFLNIWMLSNVLQNLDHKVAPRLIQPFTLPISIKWIPRASGDLMVKSKLCLISGSASLRQLNRIHKKGSWNFFIFTRMPESIETKWNIGLNRVADCRQISVLILRELSKLTFFYRLLKSWDNLRFSDDFRGNKS